MFLFILKVGYVHDVDNRVCFNTEKGLKPWCGNDLKESETYQYFQLKGCKFLLQRISLACLALEKCFGNICMTRRFMNVRTYPEKSSDIPKESSEVAVP